MGIEAAIAAASITELVSAGAAVAGVAAAGVSTVQQRDAAKKQQEQTKAANALSQRGSTRAAVREERIKRARIQQSAENQGVGGGSAEIGALGALQQNTALRESSQVQQNTLAEGQSSVNRAQVRAQTTGQVATMFGQVANTAFQLS